MLVEITKINKEEVVTCTSLDVAETFQKEHNHVMRDIRELGCSDDFRQSNFGLISYKDGLNREKSMYYMTRDGFTLLVTGYTGEKTISLSWLT